MAPPFAPPHEGGSERFCMELSKRLIKRGHEVVIYTSRTPPNLPDFSIVEGVPVVRFRTWSYMMQVNPLAFFLNTLNKNLDSFDLVHVHSYIFFFANQVALLRRVRRFPFVLHLHGGLGYIPPSLLGVKASGMKIFYDRVVGPATMASADRILTCCEQDRRDALAKFGADATRTICVPNCVDASAFRVSEPTRRRVVYVGRLTELKGVHLIPTIIRGVLRRCPDTVFTIVGDGDLFNWLKSEVAGLPVELLGRVPNRQIPSIVEGTSALMLPSFLEGFPLVVLEANAAGVPAVCFNVGGIWEAVTPETGGLVPLGDVRGFVDSLVGIISGAEARVSMGKRCRVNVEQRYDWRVAVDRIEGIYRDLV